MGGQGWKKVMSDFANVLLGYDGDTLALPKSMPEIYHTENIEEVKICNILEMNHDQGQPENVSCLSPHDVAALAAQWALGEFCSSDRAAYSNCSHYQNRCSAGYTEYRRYKRDSTLLQGLQIQSTLHLYLALMKTPPLLAIP